MKKKLGVILLSSFWVLTACAPGKQAEAATVTANTAAATTAATTAANTEASTTQADPSQDAKSQPAGETKAAEKENPETFKDLAAILGGNDETVKDLMGGGTENFSADKTLLIGREYKTTFRGEDVTVNTLYDDGKNVNMVQILLPGKDSDAYEKAITTELSAQPEKAESAESKNMFKVWKNDGKIYTLYTGYGENILEIIVPEN